MAGADLGRRDVPRLPGERQALRAEARRLSGAQSRGVSGLRRTDVHGLSLLLIR